MYINIEYNINDYINKIGWHAYVYTFFLLKQSICHGTPNLLV